MVPYPSRDRSAGSLVGDGGTSGGRIHRVDFHLHSYASNVTDYYAANSFAIPESYSDPFELYRDLKAQGMTLVTITDHNSIDGVRKLLDAGLPDVFISAEMTTTFPEDGCNIHVTVANVTETQFAEVDRLRGNLYEMIAYLDDEIAQEVSNRSGNRITYFMTHPLMSTQNRPYGREGALTAEHIEKVLVLLNGFETQNGTRTRSLNELTLRLLDGLDQATIERLADKHGLQPKGPTPWLKTMVGGSDDHSGLNPGQTWTEFLVETGRHPTANDLVDSMRRRETKAAGAHGGPVTLAHAMLKLIYDGSRQRNNGTRSVGVSGPLGSLLQLAFESGRVPLRRKISIGGKALLQSAVRRIAPRAGTTRPKSFEKTLAEQAHALLLDTDFKRRLAEAHRIDDKTFAIVTGLVNRIFAHYVGRIGSANSLDLVRLIKEAVSLVSSNVFVSLPYLLSYFHQSSDRLIIRDIRREFDIAETPKLVLMTDTFFEINGVAKTIRRMLAEAARRGIDFTVVTCLGAAEHKQRMLDPEIAQLVASGRLKIFDSIVSLDFPQYEGLQIHFPPFLEVLKFLQESGFTKVQLSTPGTVGLAGLLAAKTLQIESSSTYHTCFPEYVENYTRDISLEALAWKYMILFYHSVDEVVVPSKFIADLLHKRGLRKRKLLVLDRWVDTERFHPRKRTSGLWERFGVADADRLVKFAYVGRLGIEKNLATLAAAFRQLCQRRQDAHLFVIGDGPYRAELERQLAGLPATFAGFLEGEDLARAVASCDAKLFPSTTDTWGNAPLEAQASGLPVVVSDMGGPQELMIDGVTGFKVSGRDVEGLLQGMLALMDETTRTRMGRAARNFVERNRIGDPFSAILDSEGFRLRAKLEKRRSHHTADADHGEPDLLVAQPHGHIEELEEYVGLHG
ncbi:MAG: glycosyltransferase [Planctomycetota bacterium]